MSKNPLLSKNPKNKPAPKRGRPSNADKEAARLTALRDASKGDAGKLTKLADNANRPVWSVANIVEKLTERETIKKDPARRYTSGYAAVDGIFTSLGKKGLKCGIHLLVGDPGSGKSSWALQIMSSMRKNGHLGVYCAYEGKDNIYECIQRIGLEQNIPVVDSSDGWAADSDTMGEMLKTLQKANKTGKPAVVVIDSVKNLNEGAGGTAGRRKAIQDLMKVVADTNTILFLIGHVTKETRGKKVKRIQGPSELEELCDVRMDFIDVTPDEHKNQGYRHFMIDTSSKNRNGRPGEWYGYMLRENGFTFPERLLDKPEYAVKVRETTDEDEDNE